MSVVMSTLPTTIELFPMSCAPSTNADDVHMDGEDSLMMGQTNTTNVYPEITNDDIQVVHALLRMVAAGVDIQHMLNLAQLSPFDIIEPDYDTNNNPNPCPYIVISYAPDTEESLLAMQHNARPIQHTQDGLALMVPGFSAMRTQPEPDNDPTMTVVPDQETGAHDLANTFWWAQDDSMDTAADDLDVTLGSLYNLDFSRVGMSWTGGATGFFNAVAESPSYSGTVEPWWTRLDLLVPNPDEMSVEDWSDDYDWTNQDDNEVFGMDAEQDEWSVDDGMDTYEDQGSEMDAELEGGDYSDEDEDLSGYESESA
ncbi:hypothetical protein FRC08_009033 [Ceratobasidium sp. 394]|nr:hypothetical protein FRC08_009033 [Ceratobasidium sp. 394]